MRAIISLCIAALCLFTSGCFLFPRVPRFVPPERPKQEVPKTVIQTRTVIVQDLSSMFRICMGICLAGIGASIALCVFLPYLKMIGAGGLAAFGSVFALCFVSQLLLPYAMYIAYTVLSLAAIGIALLIYKLAHSNGILTDLASHPQILNLENGMKADTARVVKAIQKRIKK